MYMYSNTLQDKCPVHKVMENIPFQLLNHVVSEHLSVTRQLSVNLLIYYLLYSYQSTYLSIYLSMYMYMYVLIKHTF